MKSDPFDLGVLIFRRIVIYRESAKARSHTSKSSHERMSIKSPEVQFVKSKFPSAISNLSNLLHKAITYPFMEHFVGKIFKIIMYHISL